MYSQFRITATKIAKRLDISMTMVTEKLIEFHEIDKDKAREFVRAIKEFSKDTKVIELIKSRQHLDTKGFDISNSRALYLVDDKHYRKIIGEDHMEKEYQKDIKVMEESQLSLF